jgi:hypothetical protein
VSSVFRSIRRACRTSPLAAEDARTHVSSWKTSPLAARGASRRR